MVPRRVCALAALLVAAAGCSSSHGGPSAEIAVTAGGRVGPLRLDRSGRADIVAFAGKLESETRGRYDSYPRFDALGYGCAGKPAVRRDGFPSCRTVYYVELRSGRFEELYTVDPRYAGPRGIRAGMAKVAAERRLRRRVPAVGCLPDIVVSGRARKSAVAIVFGRRSIEFFVLFSARRASGAFDCIDS